MILEKPLKLLIEDYQASVLEAVKALQRSGIRLPTSARSWADDDIPRSGILLDGICYDKHGIGCAVLFPAGPVDFDFGPMGEIDGVDIWRLQKFAGPRMAEYEFKSDSSISESFNAAVSSGALIPLGPTLYCVAGTKRTLAIEVCKDFPNDLLPYRDQDEVMTLYTKCFLAANLMRKNYEKLSIKWDRDNHLNQNEKIECEIYFSSWLGYLGATCEGFRKLNMRSLLKENRPITFQAVIPSCDNIGKLMKQHADSLRKFRNNVFHLREDIKAILRFAIDESGALAWAGELHDAIAVFLNEYRMTCEMHYLKHNRISESQIGRQAQRSRKSANS